MIVRSLDSNGDMNFGKGKSDFLSDLNALVQIIGARLRSHLADCFFAENEGIDWFNLVGSKRFLDLKLALSKCILETEGVVSLSELSFNLSEQRIFTVNYTVLSVYGEASTRYVFEGIV